MNETLKSTMDMVVSMRNAAQIKTGRGFDDFFADRIVQAATKPTLLGCVEHLCKGVNVALEFVSGASVAAFVRRSNAEDADSVLSFIRQYPRVVAMVAGLRDAGDYAAALESIEIGEADALTIGSVPPRRPFDVGITATCLSPLAHGGDAKAGNATIFRRRAVKTSTGRIIDLPFYGGNSLRGMMRDMLADHFLAEMGLGKASLNLWFFYALYSGGALEEKSAATSAIIKRIGDAGATRSDGMREFRDLLPALSLLGCGLGNRIVSGRCYVNELRPRCAEWGTGERPVAELFGWEFLTRREDDESHTEHHGMIATTEVLLTGTVLDGGIDLHVHASETERAALGLGLSMLRERGYIGANANRGMGAVEIVLSDLPDPQPYLDHLRERKDAILSYLDTVEATCTQLI